jgi:MFS family permease
MNAPNAIDIHETSIRYPGWRVVGVCFAVATFGWALGFYGQSVYLAELQRVHGWPASTIATATTCFYLFGALLVAFLSEAVKAFGPRNCLLAGIVAMAGATALLGRITEPWQLYAVNALAFGWAGTSLGAITNTLGLWFDKKRGMAISLALNGASFGGIVGVPLLVAAIGGFGFAGATLAAAIAMMVVLVPLVVVFVGAPPQRARGPSMQASAPEVTLSPRNIRVQAFRDVAFITLTIAFALTLFAQVGFIVHLISYLDPVIGRERAAAAVSLLTLMAVVGRLLFSTVIDRLNQRLASALSFLSQALALAIIINSRDEVVLYFACALFGFSVGNLITLPALIVQRECDAGSFGVLISLLTAVTQITYAFGPGIIGFLHDASGSYAVPFYGCMSLQLIAAALILMRSRKVITVP